MPSIRSKIASLPHSKSKLLSSKSKILPAFRKAKASQFSPTTKTKPSLSQRVKKLLKKPDSHQRLTIDDLINAESALGRNIFGSIPAGHRREFFYHHRNTWVWHESWLEDGKDQQFTIRYQIRPDGVYKCLVGSSYLRIAGAELANFRKAAKVYLQLIKKTLY